MDPVRLSLVRLLFIIPWPLDDPLTRSTVIPHLTALAADPRVESIALFAPARFAVPTSGGAAERRQPMLLPEVVEHHPLPVRASAIPLLSRLRHHQHCSRLLQREAERIKPQLTICRGAASIHGALLQRRLAIPFVAESFEPHAHYMRQTGTWSRWDPKYLVQVSWEERVKRCAAALITVSHGYARHLKERDGVPAARLRTVPCWVDGERFRINPEARMRLRHELGIGERLALIYVGKFGGIYSPLGELAILGQLKRHLVRPLFVIVLSSMEADAVRLQLHRAGFSPWDSYVSCVPHEHVADYLNAADLAVSFINSGPWSFACSAIKHGEYWACGLPVLMPPGVGDESTWLETERVGAIAPFNNPQAVQSAATRLQQILAEPGHRQRIRAVGLRERSKASLTATYRWMLDRLELGSLGSA